MKKQIMKIDFVPATPWRGPTVDIIFIAGTCHGMSNQAEIAESHFLNYLCRIKLDKLKIT
jgi:hypothetical protein